MHDNTQAFIMRIWYEETGGPNAALIRRGSIEHVRSKKRICFDELESILPFIEEAAGTMRGGVNPGKPASDTRGSGG